MAELKLCPFCGGEAVIEHTSQYGNSSYVMCVKCHARTTGYFNSKTDTADERATNAWNGRADKRLKIIEINPSFREAVEANDGYCPCMIERTPDTKCMCLEFREQKTPGKCHCGRFEKIKED